MRGSVEMMLLICIYYLLVFQTGLKIKMLNKTDKSAK